tara:strand:- start:879 stop:1073 length:195 start_codon:yes stop_codon:yes gene_type:complete
MLVHQLLSQTEVDILVVEVLELRMIQTLKELLVVKVQYELYGEKEDNILLLVRLMFNKYNGGES